MTAHRVLIAVTVTCVALSAPALVARQPPRGVNTEVYLASFADINAHGPSAPVTLVNISNSPDYDNQPSFTPDSRSILFSSNRNGRQFDIYRYDIATKKLTQVTHTPENENSPVVTPDGRALSVVRTEPDQTQRLWRFNLDGSSPRVILDNVKAVGCYVWIDATHVALFVLGTKGQPATLQIADTATGEANTIDSDIGRPLAIRPSTHAVTYISKKDSGWSVMELRPDRALVPIALGTVGGRPMEDIVWDPSSNGRFITADDRSLISATLNDRTAVRTPFVAIRSLADLSSANIRSITRLAISPDGKWIAIVAEPVSK